MSDFRDRTKPTPLLDPLLAQEHRETKPEKMSERDPTEMSTGDWMLNPHTHLTALQRRIAYLHAAGESNRTIAQKLGISDSKVSVTLRNSKVIKQAQHYEDRMFEEDIQKRLEDLGPDAINAMTDILRNHNLDATKKEGAAKWILEKLTGKATQPVHNTGEQNLSVFLSLVQDMKESGQVIDVTGEPQSEGGEEQNQTGEEGAPLLTASAAKSETKEQKDDFASWLDKEF